MKNIKKGLIAFASVLLIVTSFYANNKPEIVRVEVKKEIDCWKFADAAATLYGMTNNLSDYEEYLFFQAVFNNCMDSGINYSD
ncbi:hypothetical protein [Hanstruepera ponticola]|uniref:hypothetical protein n=1 Tax=Hanstruepera ponticola TaxID=2042995 RepID=UPI00178044FB|nr:hypothetical protein [Hanstruepera ponticola]